MLQKKFRVVLILLMALNSPMGWSQDSTPDSTPDLARKAQLKIEFVEKFLSVSTVAKKVQASSDPDVMELYSQAQDSLQQAKIAYQAQQYAAAIAAANQALQVMFKAGKAASPGAALEKIKKDFQKQKESIAVLLAALERVAVEKNLDIAATQTIVGQVADLSEAAEQLFAAGKIKEAQGIQKIAYEKVKAELIQLRDGETLTKTLSFASAEEEYHYEIDRNDTHQMLLQMLLQTKQLSDYAKEMIEKLRPQAEQLRQEAEAQAKEGAFDQAIETLNNATKNYVRCIRMAGVYIPG